MMLILNVIFAALIVSAVADDDVTEGKISDTNSDVIKTTVQFITENNYPVEIHNVTTEDGYILTMHRIPAAKGKPVVFLMHGLLLSSAAWVLTGPGKALSYILSDAGYDVWMGNARGNVYSRNHVNKSRLTEKEYWHFDWHEIGYYDLPAMIDYTLESTGQKNLTYIGHSQGTTSFYVLTSLKPHYNDKIKVMFSLAPVAYVGNLKSPLVRLANDLRYSIELFFELFGIYEFKPTDKFTALAEETFCNDKVLTQELCTIPFFLLYGFDEEQLNRTALPTILEHDSDGASVRQLIHYGQEIDSGKFRWYDHGPIKNLAVYGSLSPPDYNLRAITAPVYLMYGDNDWLAAPKDVKQLNSQLGNVMELYRVPFKKWNHIDFLWAIDVKKYVYDHVLKILKENYQ